MANEQQYKAAGVKCLSEEAKLEQYPVISEHTDIFKSLVTNVLSQFQRETRGGGALVAAEMHTHKGLDINVTEQVMKQTSTRAVSRISPDVLGGVEPDTTLHEQQDPLAFP